MSLPLPSPLLVATHNAGKLEEFRQIFAPYGIEVQGAKQHNLAEPEETGTSFIENARIKARAAQAATGLAVLADDSGIIIDGLDGAPGVYTADWAETPHGRDFKMAMRKAYDLLEEVNAPHPRTCRFHATLILLWPDGQELIAEGNCEGYYVWPMRGAEGHGYDPCFQPDGYEITMGEMSETEKNSISHRGRAIADLLMKLGVNQNESTGILG